MTHAVLRHLEDTLADGPTQMAADEALLEAASVPTVRLYRWAAPTVSLGYFQDYATVIAALHSAGRRPPALVRRITGGGAIWHEHEITYAVVGRLGDQLPSQTAAIYGRIHGAVREALAHHGARLDRQDQTIGDRRYAQEPRCFASPAAEDLILAQGKVLGSAARTRGDRVLIHGSLKLASNPWDGAVVAGCGLDAATAATALLSGLADAFALPLAPGAWTPAEIAARTRIRHERYDNERWVQDRIGPRP